MERQSKFLKLVQAQGVEERTLAIRLCNFEQREGSQQQKGELTWLEATLASSGGAAEGVSAGSCTWSCILSVRLCFGIQLQA